MMSEEKVSEAMPEIKISVIMEVHNSIKLAEKSIDSLLNQTTDDFEILLIDNLDDESFEYIKYLYENKFNIKFIEFDGEDIETLRKTAFEESRGAYIYFCDDSYLFKRNLLEDFLETSLTTDSEMCLCNLPEGGANKNHELDFNSILGNQNLSNYTCGWQKIIPDIFNSSFELGFAFYKKSFLDNMFVKENLTADKSVLILKSVLSSSKLSFVDKFLFEYLTKDNLYYDFKFPSMLDSPLDIFNICEDIEEFLKENAVFDDLKDYFDIYKINQILLYLDYVRFYDCYSYNSPQNRDLYANEYKVLDYSQYYGSKSEHVGLDYSYANKYFNKAKEEFDKINLEKKDLDNILDENDLNKYNTVLKSDSYEEYMNTINIKRIEQLKVEQNKLKQRINNSESEKYKLTQDIEETIESNASLENEISKLKDENKTLTEENNRLRDEYWENRNLYDYILGSKSWKYTKWMRK